MPFKIVQTIEKGAIKLTTVPEQWELNGVLYWPEKKQEKRRKIESSVADYDKWSKINCIVKRKDIRTFYEAEDEIDAMSNNSETETDIENQPPNKIKRLPQKTFNDMAEAASTSSIPLPVTKTQSTDHNQFIARRKRPINPDPDALNDASGVEANSFPIINLNETDLIFQEISLQEESKENENNVTVTETPSESILNEIKSLKNDIETVKNNIETVTENQTVLESNQNTIISQISELSIKLEEFIKLSLSTKKKENSGASIIKIHNQKNFEEFERKLEEPDSRDELYRQYSVILSEGIGKGTTNAYTLVDAMFERKFFTQCSWTGVSKGDATKICFKGFTKTINFFFNVVHQSDNTFTKAQLIKFFKTILRNARSRSLNEQVRMSGQRQKKKASKKQTKSLSSVPDNLENPSSDQNQSELPDLESETNQLRSVPLLQENQQTKSANGDDE